MLTTETKDMLTTETKDMLTYCSVMYMYMWTGLCLLPWLCVAIN